MSHRDFKTLTVRLSWCSALSRKQLLDSDRGGLTEGDGGGWLVMSRPFDSRTELRLPVFFTRC